MGNKYSKLNYAYIAHKRINRAKKKTASKELLKEYTRIPESVVTLENVDPLALLSDPNLSSSTCNDQSTATIQLKTSKTTEYIET